MISSAVVYVLSPLILAARDLGFHTRSSFGFVFKVNHFYSMFSSGLQGDISYRKARGVILSAIRVSWILYLSNERIRLTGVLRYITSVLRRSAVNRRVGPRKAEVLTKATWATVISFRTEFCTLPTTSYIRIEAKHRSRVVVQVENPARREQTKGDILACYLLTKPNSWI